ncbi:MAG: 1-deoxy-D-xylulose-5-phosphate synthase [Wujia sp.]|nr:1-deoxy-D-xylulose-5-phosphate synthase [Wujia sp.]MDY3726787.1 1-deoxy-D-xylulose-5-phosphate synthase [Wujia sp.]
MQILDRITKENDIKEIDRQEYPELAQEIREFLIEKVSEHGGHLASNLGTVELTMALHAVMNFPEDKLIFDVGHQSYTHKILTGRKELFDSLRQYDGLSGFPKRAESPCDAFDTGHSSTGISAAMGYAVARDMRGTDERVAVIIGDGSLTGGMAYEALNGLAQLKTGCVVIINDNEMSIDRNVGGLSKYLNEIRLGNAYNELKTGVESSLLGSKAGTRIAKILKRSKDNIKQFFVPGMFFEELGITYVGPIDGHNINQMIQIFQQAFRLEKPIIIHVKTKKGKGYGYAERHPDYFHGIAPFDPKTGKVLEPKKTSCYTDIFGRKLVALGREHEDLVTITAAMAQGTGLSRFQEAYPDRFFDVGIAEQHAVTFAAGMAAAGLVPVVAVYSSFLQRAYDQILHDVCLQKLHVIFAIDRAGLVGQDGETHQGIYDVAYLSHMPNMTVLAPKNRYELEKMLEYAYSCDGPVAIRYPRGSAYKGHADALAKIETGRSEVLEEADEVCVFACGHKMEEADRLVDMLKERQIPVTLVNVRFMSEVDEALVGRLAQTHRIFVTLEDAVWDGSYSERLLMFLACHKSPDSYTFLSGAIPRQSVPQGSIRELCAAMKIDAESLLAKIEAARG